MSLGTTTISQSPTKPQTVMDLGEVAAIVSAFVGAGIQESVHDWKKYSVPIPSVSTAFANQMTKNIEKGQTAVSGSMMVDMASGPLFFKSLVDQSEAGQLRHAMRRVHYKISHLIDSNETAYINDMLMSVPVYKLAPKIAMSFLMATATIPAEVVPYRKNFRKILFDRYEREHGPQEALEILNEIE